MANTPSVFPIDFDFYNENEENTLYISNDIAGQKMYVEIKNTSTKDISFKKLNTHISATDHHFELVFRPGTVSNIPNYIALGIMKSGEVTGTVAADSDGTQYTYYRNSDFEMLIISDKHGSIKPNADGTHSLYFKANKNSKLVNGGKIVIPLFGANANKTGGTRGTRVMLKYKNLLHVGSSNAFSGNKEVNFNIINHRGKKQIPLFVGFAGSNAVLNDGEHENTLKLRITNTSRKGKTIDADGNSKMIISFDAGPPKDEWTLATSKKLKGIKINATYPDGSTAELTKPTGSNEWTLPFKRLPKGKVINLTISEIITGHPTGHANIYVHYENIPGYWDGELVSVIEKSPLVTRGGKVGIGTPGPRGILHLQMPSNGRGLEIISPSAGNTHFPWINNWNYISGKGIIFRNTTNVETGRLDSVNGRLGLGTSGPATKLHLVSKNETGNGYGALVIGPTNQANLRLGQNKTYSWVQSHGSKPLALNPVGNNVGIKTTDPKADLDVNGTVKAKLVDVNGTVKAKLADINGTVKAKLADVNGTVKAKLVDVNGTVKAKLVDAPTVNTKLINLSPSKNKQGINIISPSAGNTHLPWSNNWNYISGKGLILRNQSNAEKFRFDMGTGRLGLGTGSPAINLHIARNGVNQPGLRIDGNGAYWDMKVEANDTGDQDLLFVYKGGALTGNWASLWIEPKGGSRKPSDKRLKKDIQPIKNAIKDILKLKPSTFRWKSETKRNAPKTYGFIAQEVEKVFPEIVKEKNGYKGLAYDDFTSIAVAAIQEQQAELDTCKKQLKAQESLIAKLSKRLDKLEAK